MLEQEVPDYLGHEQHQRRKPRQEARGYRNGYEVGPMRTCEGEISVQAPQMCAAAETYRMQLIEALRGHSAVLQRLAVEMYARRLSTRYLHSRGLRTTPANGAA
jgi:transposase-like protein